MKQTYWTHYTIKNLRNIFLLTHYVEKTPHRISNPHMNYRKQEEQSILHTEQKENMPIISS